MPARNCHDTIFLLIYKRDSLVRIIMKAIFNKFTARVLSLGMLAGNSPFLVISNRKTPVFLIGKA